MLEPSLPRLLAALVQATLAGRITWEEDGEAFMFTGSDAAVRIEDPGLWPRLVILNGHGYEVTSATFPTGEALFDTGLRGLMHAIEGSVQKRVDEETRRERVRIAARDALIESMLAELERLPVRI